MEGRVPNKTAVVSNVNNFPLATVKCKLSVEVVVEQGALGNKLEEQ